MIRKIITFGVVIIGVISGFVIANPHQAHHGHGFPLPVVHINLDGLKALIKNPPIPIVKLPPLYLPKPATHNYEMPVIPLASSGHQSHHDSKLKIGDLLNSIIGANSWDSWA